MIVIPLINYNNLNLSYGNNIKEMSIAIKNDEVNYSDCQDFNVHGCITDNNSNMTMSCVIINNLISLNNYTLVSHTILN